jgi:glycosyltransferase involved in cell wall biosynthesis
VSRGLRGAIGSDATHALRDVQSTLRTGQLYRALRTLDRAWRCLPHEIATLAPIYGRLLMLEARDHDAACVLLDHAAGIAPDPDIAALKILALLRLQRAAEARQHFQAAVAHYAVRTGDLLSRAASEVAGHPDIGTPGWIARGPELELVGELSSSEPSNALEIRRGGQPAFSQLLRHTGGNNRRGFRFRSPSNNVEEIIEVTSRGVPLLGSGTRPAADFHLDGVCNSRGHRLQGWVRIGWLPSSPVALRIEDERGTRRACRPERHPLTGWRWPVDIDLRASRLRGHRITISARLPDGRWRPLPNSPLLLDPALRLAGARPKALPKWPARPARFRATQILSQKARYADVIVVIAPDEAAPLARIDAVLASVQGRAGVIAVLAADGDPKLMAALDARAADGRVTSLRPSAHQKALGAVAQALALRPQHDAVIMSSNARVFDDWLPRLRAAAYSEATVGTAIPWSNAHAIASYPNTAQPGVVAPGIDAEDAPGLHALAAATHSGARVPVPVGSGTCLYLRRDCLNDVGALDSEVFADLHGIVLDFCLRAQNRGWSHRLAADVFVYQAGYNDPERSGIPPMDRSQRLLNRRYPGYDRYLAEFQSQQSLQRLRRRLDERRLSAVDGRWVLIVTLALTGGVDRFVAERCRSLRARNLSPLVLRPAAAGDARRCELWTDAIDAPHLRYDVPADLPELVAVLEGLELEAIEIQHFLHLDARVIDAVRALPIPYDVIVHDYAWICPRVTLIDESLRYCGEPAVSVCRTCVRRNGSNLGEAISVPALRARSDTWLRAARRVIAPTRDTADRLRRHFEGLEVVVQPHALPVAPTPIASRVPSAHGLRVALIGAIGDHKGYSLLLACARDARARRLPIEFVVIGYTQDDATLMATGKVFVTGRYAESEAPHLIRRERPDLAWFASVWPETWCYTLDYALGAGLPVVAFGLGAIAERLRSAGVGVLLPLDLAPRQLNDRLLQLGARSAQPAQVTSHSVQTPLAPGRPGATIIASADSPVQVKVNRNSNGKPAPEPPIEGLSASVQVLPLPAGLYLFSVKTAGTPAAKSNGQLALPALHVGLGPGVRSEQIEFVAGPSTEGAWLFAVGDLLVTKVKGNGATLILTSVRGPGGEVLGIKVERLDVRADADPAAATTAAPRTAAPVVATGASVPPTPASPVPTPAAKSAPKGPANIPDSVASSLPVPLHVQAHIRSRGDMSFAAVPWAGRIAPGLWIESFSIRPLERLGPQDIEYKGLTGTGFETPWLSEDKMCGTRGMAVPLVGFAVRLKPGSAATAYESEYSGFFKSGLTVGPLRNGAPCRSTLANDPLEGIQVRILKRSSATAPAVTVTPPITPPRSATPSASPPANHKAGNHKTNGAKVSAQTVAKSKPAPHAPARPRDRNIPVARHSSRSARSTRRHSSRRP